MKNTKGVSVDILFCGYRDWAKNIYRSLAISHDIELCESQSKLNSLNPKDYDIIFFAGWSDIVSDDWTNNASCVCLHPSPLPKYRGGSPIQNQIIAGEKWSAVTLFQMNNKLDQGNIIKQNIFSLHGSLDDIFSRIETLAISMIDDIINSNYFSSYKQNEDEATYCKRRTPDMSKIETEDFKNFTAEEIYNKIRCLQNPYPLPYVVCKNNTKLYILEAST